MRLWQRLRDVFRKETLDRDFSDEMASHITLAREEYIRSGMAPEDAQRAAVKRLGGMTATSELHRETRGVPVLETFWQDLRYALRTFRRDPGFTFIAISVLAIGIAANCAMFSVVNTILLRPLPFADSERLIWLANQFEGSEKAGLSGATSQADVFEAWQRHNRTFEELTTFNAFYAYGSQKLSGGGDPERLMGVEVAGNFFPLLGVRPHIGRSFTAEECKQNGPSAAMISHGLWKRRFGGDPSIVGRPVVLNDKPSTVVGVLPESFDFGSVFAPGTRVDIFVPLSLDVVRNWGNTLAVVGRLKTGVSLAAARSEFAALMPQLLERNPRWKGWTGAALSGLKDQVAGQFRRPLWIMWAAVGAVMLIVAVNLANLLLGRAAARRQEMAVRTAIGAGASRLVRQLITEGLALSSAGAALGFALAYGITGYVATTKGIDIPLLSAVRVDTAALAVAAVLALGTGILLGLAPMLQVFGANLASGLKENARGSSGAIRGGWIRSALVVSQISIACVLLIGAGLLLRSFLRVLDVDLGFDPSRAAALRIHRNAQYATRDQRRVFFDEMVRRIEAVPGVEAAGITDTLPLDRNRSWGFGVKGRVFPKNEGPSAFPRRVGIGYFRAMGIPVMAGRGFNEHDKSEGRQVVIINQKMAQNLWPGANAVGQSLLFGKTEIEVIGVVGNVRHASLEKDAGNEMYFASSQAVPVDAVDLVIRSKAEPSMLAGSVRQALWSLDPTLPMTDFQPLTYLVDRAVSPRRFFVSLLSCFGGIGLVLAALGIYGVISYSVRQRTQEIGIRMALGASPGDVRGAVLGDTLRLTMVGLAIGGVASIALTRIMSGLLFQTDPTDPVALLGTLVVLIAVAVAAGYMPARNASRIDPAIALRSN